MKKIVVGLYIFCCFQGSAGAVEVNWTLGDTQKSTLNPIIGEMKATYNDNSHIRLKIDFIAQSVDKNKKEIKTIQIAQDNFQGETFHYKNIISDDLNEIVTGQIHLEGGCYILDFDQHYEKIEKSNTLLKSPSSRPYNHLGSWSGRSCSAH